MLHELLLALRGHSGYIYTEHDQKLTVNPSVTLLHPCEVSGGRLKVVITLLMLLSEGGHPEQLAGDWQ